jgi:hypothetical protein
MGTYAFDPSRAMVVEIGCKDFLQKPVTRSKLSLLLARIKIDSTTPTPALHDTPPKLAGMHLLYAEDSLPSQVTSKTQTSTLNPIPYTLNPEPYTANPKPNTLNPKLYTLNLEF